MLRKYFPMTGKQQGIPLKFFGKDVNFPNFPKWEGGGAAFSLHFWLAFGKSLMGTNILWEGKMDFFGD